MTRIPPPLLGYNNNVRYLGRTFHIQTEDSGTKYARIMTHLFIDGGRIVKTTRTEYGAVVDQPNMVETVRRMMKEQHKNMFLSLRGGEFDELIERVLNADSLTAGVDPALSRIPRLRADSLPSLTFGAGEEAKTTPGMSTLMIESPFVPPSTTEPSQVAVQEHIGVAAVGTSATRGESDKAAARHSNAAPKRPTTRPRKGKSLAPVASRRAPLVDDPTPADLPPTEVPPPHGKPSDRSSRKIPIRPPTMTKEAIDPRSQSIFGDNAAGRQSLDDVILSFLEDEDT